MSKCIAISNQKGGVGKTTTAINLAAALVAMHATVLLVDLDPQGNATMGSGVDKSSLSTSCADVLLEEQAIAQTILSTPGGYDLLASNRDLTAAEVGLIQQETGSTRLRQALAAAQSYDYIIIDCPPALNMLTLNAFAAADSVLIPMQCEYFALEGIVALLETIEQIKAEINPKLEVEGILRTMYDGRNRLGSEVSRQLLAHFGDKVYRTVIPRNIRLAEAPSHGLPVLQYDKRSPGASAYLVLAGEMLRKQSQKAKHAKATIE